MGADSDTLNQWTPAPGLTDEWRPRENGPGKLWVSPCGRVKVEIAPSPFTSGDWMYFASLIDGHESVRPITCSEAAAKRLGLDWAKNLIAKLDAKDVQVAKANEDVAECGCRFERSVLAGACEQHREPVAPVPAGVWERYTRGKGQWWTSQCGRVWCDVWLERTPLNHREWVSIAEWYGSPCRDNSQFIRSASESEAMRLGIDAAQKLLAKLGAKAAPADEWRWNGAGAHEWRSSCGRVKAMVWHNTHGKDWRFTVDSPGRSTDPVGYPASTREIAQTEALKDARDRLAELDKAAPPSFTKLDADKPRTDLLPPLALLEVSRVLGHGAAKYGHDNHLRDGDGVEGRYMGATLRHLFAHMGGARNDVESGMPHAAHAAANLLLLLEGAAKGAGK